MSSRKQREPSPLWSRGDLIDQLIHQSLLGDVSGAEPSPRVWENICRRLTATEAPCQRKGPEGWVLLLLDGALTVLNALLDDGDWETRLMEQRKLTFGFLPFSCNPILAV